MYIIGLTGNIATGKSTVCEILEQLGARVIDADKLAHAALKRGAPAWRGVIDAFGYDILQADGNVDRRKLGAVVFGDAAKLRVLEQLTHPAVGTELALMVRDALNAPGAQEQVLVVEAVKLYEAGMHEFMDALWVVTAPIEEQRRRLMQDRGMSQADADARLAAQPALDAKLARADVVIDNGASIEETRVQVLRAFAMIDPATAIDKTPLILKWLRLEPKTAPTPSATELSTAGPEREPESVGTSQPETVAAVSTATVGPSQGTNGTTETTAASWIVRRAAPSDARSLASLLARIEGRAEPLGREEMLERQGKYAYWLVLGNNRPVALAAWQAENLAAIVRELWTANPDDAPRALSQLLEAIEIEADALTCEVVVLLVPARATDPAHIAAESSGYALTTLDELKTWRSVIEPLRQHDEPIYAKRLREIVTRPI